MQLHEMNARLKKSGEATPAQLEAIHPIYCLLGFDKDDFCKLIDALGIDKWTAQAKQWARLDTAERELAAKERYLKEKARLKEVSARITEMKDEHDALITSVGAYDAIIAELRR